jgi:hypothetical protein
MMHPVVQEAHVQVVVEDKYILLVVVASKDPMEAAGVVVVASNDPMEAVGVEAEMKYDRKVSAVLVVGLANELLAVEDSLQSAARKDNHNLVALKDRLVVGSVQ